MPTATDQHRWLHRFVGTWRSETACDPENPDFKTETTEVITVLGDIWIEARGKGMMPVSDIEAHTRLILGFDPSKEKFVGTWIGTMMTNLWVYEGELDAEGNILTLNCEGPSFSGDGSIQPYQDIHEFIDDNHRVLRTRTRGEDGTWSDFFMQTDYYRVQ